MNQRNKQKQEEVRNINHWEQVGINERKIEQEGEKWNEIDKTMDGKQEGVERIGKQCREKWGNRVDWRTKSEIWGYEDSKKLFGFHAVYGNKWAKIALMFGDRSDNSVKNHFYSTLRKGYRIVNKFIKQQRKNISQRPLKDNILSKIINLSESSFLSENFNQLVSKSKNILTCLVNIAQLQINQCSISFMKEVINDLLEINKGYKLTKSNKRNRKQTLIFEEQKVSIELDIKLDQKVSKFPTSTSLISKQNSPLKPGFKQFIPSTFQNQKIFDNQYQTQPTKQIENNSIFFPNQFQYSHYQIPFNNHYFLSQTQFSTFYFPYVQPYLIQ